jgi:hypothetical protein
MSMMERMGWISWAGPMICVINMRSRCFLR